MGRIRSVFLVLFFLSFGLVAQAQDRYAVYYKFKPQNGLTLQQPQAYLTGKALQRRQREGLAMDSLDLPVSGKYVELISKNSDYILYHSKWLNASVIIAKSGQIEEIKKFPFVERTELVAPGFSPPPSARIESLIRVSASAQVNCDSKINSRILDLAENSYDFQNQLIGIDKMHKEGFAGKGITVAVLDAGFPGVNTASVFSHLFSGNQIIGQKNIVKPWSPHVFTDHQHGTNVLSLIAAKETGKLVSGAYDSNYILIITEDFATEYRIEELNWVRGAEFADSLGVDIINSSVGYWDFDDPKMNYTLADLDGKTTTITRGANVASKKGILVVNSVGNYGAGGTSTLIAPADSKEVLAIGSVTKTSTVSGFSSRGPTGDGRIKPDLAAFGDSPVLIRSNGTAGISSGTSFSAPQITALAAGLWQAKPEWKKADLLNALIKSATQFQTPDNSLGYGIPDFFKAFFGEILSLPEETSEWKIYPNPLIENELKILFGSSLEGNFELLDMTGKIIIETVLRRNDTKSPFLISVENLKPGLYLVRFGTGINRIQTKLIRQ
jgi:subtilisin family serine protease